MTRLILMRHAKAERGGPETRDADRPLAARGREDALRLGDWMRREGYVPDLALVSPARRTMETWEGLALGAPMEAARGLYGAPAEAILAAVRGREGTVLVIGHNPGIGAAAAWLAGGDGRFPTGTAAVIDLEGEMEAGGGRLRAFVTPGELGG